MEKRPKIAKKDRKIALFSLFLLYLYHIWKFRGARPLSPLPTPMATLHVSSLPWSGPRAPSPRSTLVHTNYTTARTQIEVPFYTGCAGTTERSR